MASLPPKVGCRPRFQKIFFTYFPEKVKRKLKLPVKFVKDHGDELSNPVHFKFRGTEWPMKLKRHKDEAWFDKGWEEFSKSYSFEYNDLLIFAYEGNSTFQVSLFDRPPKLIESDEDDIIPPSPQPHITTHSSGGQAEVQEEASSLETIHRSRSELKRKRDLVAEKDDGEAEYELNTRQGIKNSRMRRKLDFSGKRNRGERFQRASETMQRVKPEYPLFKIELLQNVNYGLILSLPYEFMRTHLSSESGEVTLQVSDGRIWKVALKCENSRAEFHDHWWEFIQDNQLKVGDACVFMLIDNARPLFEVVIFHKDQTIQPINCVLPTDNTCIDNASIDEDNEDEEDNNENDHDNNIDAEDDNTSFEIVIQPSYTNHLWLPSKFSQIFLTSDATYASLCVSGGKSNWPVKLKHYGQRVQLQAGWSNFVQDNNLKVGHVCKFMFNDTARLSFEVAIEAGNTLAKRDLVAEKDDQDNDIDAEDDNTSFEIVIQPSYIKHLWLPSKFSQTYPASDATYASLCVPVGNGNWHVKLKHYGQRVQLQDGWSKFVQDNNVKVGHVCKFSFNDANRISFEVAIEAGGILNIDEDDGNNSEIDDDENEYSEFIESSVAPQPHKRKRTGCNRPIEAHSNIKDISGSSSTKQFLQQRPKVSRTKHLVKGMGDDPAHRRAKAFKPGKPFFMVTMSPTYVHARYLHLPSAFAKEHLKEQPSKVHLRDSNEIKWPVEFRHSTRARFRVGWWEFVQGNNLKVGDVCVFVLIEKSEFLFGVHFFRST